VTNDSLVLNPSSHYKDYIQNIVQLKNIFGSFISFKLDESFCLRITFYEFSIHFTIIIIY